MAWFRLGLAGNFVLLTVFTLGTLQSRGLLTYAGNDYRAFRSVAAIARDHGYSEVYEAQLLEDYQQDLVDSYASPLGRAEFVAMPAPFPPAFLPLLNVALLLSPAAGYLAWTLLSAILIALSFRPGFRALHADHRSTLAAAAFLSLPVYLTLLFGQVTAWMCLGLSGFLLAARDGKSFRSGLWLTLLLIKPQSLIVLGPGLLVSRRYRALSGLLAGTVAVLVLSYGLAGEAGLAALVRLYVSYPGNLAYTFPESMMNWRALAVQIGHSVGTNTEALAIVASLATAALGIWLWSRPGVTRSRAGLPAVVAASYAAASLSGWHAHIHMAAPIFLPLLLLWPEARSWRTFLAVWVLLPTFVFGLAGIAAGPGPAHQMAGMAMVLLNLATLALATAAISRTGVPARPESVPARAPG
jgi:hypothetical protein